MSDATDYLKYVADRTVAYLNVPEEEREERKERRKSRREPWLTRWFGLLLPMGVEIWWNNRKKQDKPHAPGS